MTTRKRPIMRSGLQTINFFTLFFLSFTFLNIVIAEDVQLGPLINLDQIEPSYDSFDDELDQDKLEDHMSIENTAVNKKDASFASLSILNKITANVDTLNIKLKQNVYHGELRIYPIDCYLSSPEERSETAIYINVYHEPKDEKIFSGWMLKTLPSISAIEHPIYDIWVNDCY